MDNKYKPTGKDYSSIVDKHYQNVGLTKISGLSKEEVDDILFTLNDSLSLQEKDHVWKMGMGLSTSSKEFVKILADIRSQVKSTLSQLKDKTEFEKAKGVLESLRNPEVIGKQVDTLMDTYFKTMTSMATKDPAKISPHDQTIFTDTFMKMKSLLSFSRDIDKHVKYIGNLLKNKNVKKLLSTHINGSNTPFASALKKEYPNITDDQITDAYIKNFYLDISSFAEDKKAFVVNLEKNRLNLTDLIRIYASLDESKLLLVVWKAN
jgi:hypothetical protein